MGETKKFNNCIIMFDQNEFGTYFTGQIVSGKVVVTLEKSKKLKGIKLQICGFAACQWREKYGQKLAVQKINPRVKRIYFGREEYIASTTYLVGSEHGSNFNMDAGTYTYTFSCPIPPNCPSSFESTYGHIRYLAKVTFIRNGAADRVHNVGFTVLKLLDLNQESKMLKSPATNDALENVCFFLSKAVHLKVDLQQTGYVPGQYVLVSADVDNQSSVDCKKLIITLNLRATYTSDTPALRTVSEKICLAKKVCGHVPRYMRKAFAETIRVPATAPTCEHISKVVRVSYELCVQAMMSSVMRNPKTVIPITIGNVPLTTADEEEWLEEEGGGEDVPTTSAGHVRSTREMESDIGAIRAVSEEDTSEAEEGIDLPPPTYEEAMFMSTNIADNDTNIVSVDAPFTPRYPVFNVDEANLALGGMGLSPPPNLPQKRKRRRRRCRAPEAAPMEFLKERPPTESPIQI
ncbi:arrestin domain-containing protein 5 isoform X2 [Rhagoletis pomonella]|uniref:arrestin domain-containing protein 5 isoform X2 n=1 Tax=Rhagoletis pomonella TaxID=28610 RepID=UPI001781E66C|nr:arrestin domain-containing protein 5 isoform X2 [Rhagoletis pomonella]